MSSTIANSPRSCASARLAAASEAVAAHLALHQVRHHLGVGLGNEPVALLLELALELQVVLDDAVVDDDEAARAVAVRMRVLFGGPSVRRPARVPEPVRAGHRFRGQHLLEIRELAGTAADVDVAVVDDGDARRVVAAILESSQPVDEDRDDGPRADVADDAAHNSANWEVLSAKWSEEWAVTSGKCDARAERAESARILTSDFPLLTPLSTLHF